MLLYLYYLVKYWVIILLTLTLVFLLFKTWMSGKIWVVLLILGYTGGCNAYYDVFDHGGVFDAVISSYRHQLPSNFTCHVKIGNINGPTICSKVSKSTCSFEFCIHFKNFTYKPMSFGLTGISTMVHESQNCYEWRNHPPISINGKKPYKHELISIMNYTDRFTESRPTHMALYMIHSHQYNCSKYFFSCDSSDYTPLNMSAPITLVWNRTKYNRKTRSLSQKTFMYDENVQCVNCWCYYCDNDRILSEIMTRVADQNDKMEESIRKVAKAVEILYELTGHSCKLEHHLMEIQINSTLGSEFIGCSIISKYENWHTNFTDNMRSLAIEWEANKWREQAKSALQNNYQWILLVLIGLLVFVNLFVKARQHYHVVTDAGVVCPWPHSVNRKGQCSCGEKMQTRGLSSCMMAKA